MAAPTCNAMHRDASCPALFYQLRTRNLSSMSMRLGLLAALMCLTPLAAFAAPPEQPQPPAAPTATQPPPAPAAEPAPPAKPAEQDVKKAEPAAETPAGTAEGTKDEELICKRVDKVSGSRMGTRRLCLTKEEWRDYKEE